MRRHRTITVGGLPGTGSTTLCRLLERELGLPFVLSGQIFRQQAAERGLTLDEFNQLAQEDEQVDRSLDDRQLELLRTGGLVLEGRLSGWLAHTNGIPAFKVWVTCADAERVRRLVARDGADPDTQAAAMQDRAERERDRYARYYGADLDDLSFYDLVIDSTHTPPEKLVEDIISALESSAVDG